MKNTVTIKRRLLKNASFVLRNVKKNKNNNFDG